MPARPVAAVVGELLRAVVIILIVGAVLAVTAGALRLRHRQPRALPPRVYGTTSVPAVQDRPEPRALPARQEVHLHFHGVTPAEVAAIIAEHQRSGRAR